MTKIADLFQPRPDSFLSDPRLRGWQSLIESGAKLILGIDWALTGFGQIKPRMTVQFYKDNGMAGPDEVFLWDDDLNTGLIELKVKAEDNRQEADRFSLSLDTAFTPAERVGGNGFFNSVLFDYINKSDLAENEMIAVLLRNNNVVSLDHQSPKYDRCWELIDDAIRGQALDLKDHLEYPIAEAEEILVNAITRYLHQRFSTSLPHGRGSL